LPPPASVSQLQAGDIDLYHAIVVQPPAPNALGVRLYNVVAKMKPGVTIAQVTAELDAIHAAVDRANARRTPPSHLRVESFADKLTGRARTPLFLLLAAVGVVLAIACANLANLLLARASVRRREIAIRIAIGAGRARVLRQFVVESLLLAIAGGATGLVVARAGVALMLRLIPQAVPRLTETTIDGRVLAFAAAISMATALACGVAPAMTFWRSSPHDALKDGAQTSSASSSGLRLRRLLVAAEVALAAVLLLGAGLLVRSFWRITAYPPGFTPERVLTMRFQFSGPRYREAAARRAYVDELIARAQSFPGVEAAGVSSNGEARMVLAIEGAPPEPLETRPRVVMTIASAGYANAIGMRLVRGRWLVAGDPSPGFVINEALARRHFPGVDPIGRRILLPNGPDPKNARFVPVVGIVADLRYANLERAAEPVMFVSYEHANPFGMMLAMRIDGDPSAAAPAIRARLTTVDPTQPLFNVTMLDAALADTIAPRRFNLMLLGSFAATALLLAVVGIYGVIAYAVAQRAHEIGVRMALGAERHDVVRMVVRQGMAVAGTGIAVGLAAALAVSRVMTRLLYEISPTDPATFAAVAASLAATALAACAVPAIRAALVDPMVALRCE